MDTAYISALSALAGSVVGGLTSGFTTWLGQRAQARAGQFAHDKAQRWRIRTESGRWLQSEPDGFSDVQIFDPSTLSPTTSLFACYQLLTNLERQWHAPFLL